MSDQDDVIVALQADPGVPTPVTDPDVLRAHGRDQAALCAAGRAVAMIRPRTTAEVSAVLRVASWHRTPVVTQGARAGLSGGANAVDGCIILNLQLMDQVLTVDRGELLAVVQPGVVNADLSRAVREQGLFYPPDPASWESCTIGGNVATNAGGLCCVKYGVTGDYVRALEVVTADGSVLRTGRRTRKGVAGYDLTHLFVGSEGTLGVITEITVGLRPQPAATRTAVAYFTDGPSACDAVNAYMSTGAQPSMLELMDGPTLDVVSAYRDLGLPDGTRALVIAQCDDGRSAAPDLVQFVEVCTAQGAEEVLIAEDEAEADLLVEARRLVGPAHESLGTELVEDVCVPRARLADLLRGVARIGVEHGVLVTCAGHAGDGNMHPSIVFDATDATAARNALAAFDDVMRLGLALGGTITGEHGVGLLKRSWLEVEMGLIGLRLQQTIKDALDPQHILNPGKVVREALA
jgi:glycolate oxidase